MVDPGDVVDIYDVPSRISAAVHSFYLFIFTSFVLCFECTNRFGAFTMVRRNHSCPRYSPFTAATGETDE